MTVLVSEVLCSGPMTRAKTFSPQLSTILLFAAIRFHLYADMHNVYDVTHLNERGPPQLPTGLRVTFDMENLLVALLKPKDSSNSGQVGFCGMGGIGKTVVSNWLVRNLDVRRKFNKILWVTLGMTPNMSRCQGLLYMQLTGSELMTSDVSAVETAQLLKHTFEGQNVLLVLDDCWEHEHAAMLNFIDDSTPSKVLVSSRVRGVLEGGLIVDLGLPSNDDAIRMLLKEAGLGNIDPSEAPPEAMAVVAFCNNLPLAVGIAGSMLKKMSLGVDDDWSGIVGVLKSEFGEGGQSRAMENSVIRTSLKSIKGSQQAEVMQLLTAFGMVPEDTTCPLEVIGMMFAAVGKARNARPKLQRIPPRLLVRKWLKLLIDRSLVLGTVDKPQLHDVVLEFALDQLDSDQTREAHRCLVQTFQDARPVSSLGGWQVLLCLTNLTARYIVNESDFHVASSWQKTNVMNDDVPVSWLTNHVNGKFDCIAASAVKHVGLESVQKLADQKKEEGDMWISSLLYHVASRHVLYMSDNMVLALSLAKSCLETIKAAEISVLDAEMAYARDTVVLRSTFDVLKGWVQEDTVLFLPEISTLKASKACQDDLMMFLGYRLMDLFSETLFQMTEDVWEDQLRAHAALCEEMHAKQLTLSHDPLMQRRAKVISTVLSGMLFDSLMTLVPEKHLKLMGPRGAHIMEYFKLYNRHADHQDVMGLFGLDPYICFTGFSVLPLMFIWGEVEKATELFDFHLTEGFVSNSMVRAGVGSEIMPAVYISHTLGAISVVMNRGSDVLRLLVDVYQTFDGIGVIYNRLAGVNETISTEEKPAGLCRLDTLVSYMQAIWCLAASKEDLLKKHPKEYYFASFPAAETWSRRLRTMDTLHPHPSVIEFCNMCWIALAFEKMGMPEKAFEFAEVGLWTDFERGGSNVRYNHSICLGVLGRVRKSQGELLEAAANFEQAADTAALNLYGFLEAVALRDWKSVLDPETDEAAKVEARFAEVMGGLGLECKASVEHAVATVFLF